MSKHVQNKKHQLVDLLVHLSDFERQRKCKDAVPFVHIPLELFAQLHSYLPENGGREWYREVVTTQLLQAHLTGLHDTMGEHAVKCPERRSDVPAVFERESWQAVRRCAQNLLEVLYQEQSYQDTLTLYWED